MGEKSVLPILITPASCSPASCSMGDISGEKVPAEVVESLPLFDEQGEEWTVEVDVMIFSFCTK